MNQLTVRGFDDALIASLSQLAEREGISLSKAAVKLMRKGAGLIDGKVDGKARGGPVGNALDDLRGAWTKEEADAFNAVIEEAFEVIDEEMWR